MKLALPVWGFHRESACADASVGDDDEGARGEVLGHLVEVRKNHGGEGVGLLVGAAEQDNAWRQDGCVGEEFPEVGIGGDKDPGFASASAMICSSGWPPRPSS